MRLIARRYVLLPQPLGPMVAVVFRGGSRGLTSLIACFRRYHTERFFDSIAGSSITTDTAGSGMRSGSASVTVDSPRAAGLRNIDSPPLPLQPVSQDDGGPVHGEEDEEQDDHPSRRDAVPRGPRLEVRVDLNGHDDEEGVGTPWEELHEGDRPEDDERRRFAHGPRVDPPHAVP